MNVSESMEMLGQIEQHEQNDLLQCAFSQQAIEPARASETTTERREAMRETKRLHYAQHEVESH